MSIESLKCGHLFQCLVGAGIDSILGFFFSCIGFIQALCFKVNLLIFLFFQMIEDSFVLLRFFKFIRSLCIFEFLTRMICFLKILNVCLYDILSFLYLLICF